MGEQSSSSKMCASICARSTLVQCPLLFYSTARRHIIIRGYFILVLSSFHVISSHTHGDHSVHYNQIGNLKLFRELIPKFAFAHKHIYIHSWSDVWMLDSRKKTKTKNYVRFRHFTLIRSEWRTVWQWSEWDFCSFWTIQSERSEATTKQHEIMKMTVRTKSHIISVRIDVIIKQSRIIWRVDV